MRKYQIINYELKSCRVQRSLLIWEEGRGVGGRGRVSEVEEESPNSTSQGLLYSEALA